MDRNTKLVIVLGLVIVTILYFVNIYLAGIVFIILLVLVMSLFIMEDSRHAPNIVAELSDTAKAVVIKNTGNSPAVRIRTTLIPANITFEQPSLDPDALVEYPLEGMVERIKVVITYRNDQDAEYSHTYTLSALDIGYDPLKPMFPLFRWK
jgi:hypothetical protein